MLLPLDVVLRGLRREYAQFLPLLADSKTQASGAVAAGHAIDLLVQRAEGGLPQLRTQAEAFHRAAMALAAQINPGPTVSALEQLAGSLADFSPPSLEGGEAVAPRGDGPVRSHRRRRPGRACQWAGRDRPD